jgi:hypothetical protein
MDTNTHFYRHTFRYGLTACLLLLAIVALALAGLISRGPLTWFTLGFLLSVAMRSAALMTNVLLWRRRELRWRRGQAVRG